METFSWVSQLQYGAGGDLVLACGEGFVTATGGANSYGSVAELRAGTRPGHLLSASALVQVSDGRQQRFVVLRRDARADIAPGQWHFPAVRCAHGELPLAAACRGLTSEIRIDGAAHDWRDVRIRVGGPQVDYITGEGIVSLRARHVLADNTLEFYYPMALEVASLADVKLSDAAPHQRRVALLEAGEIADLARAGELAPGARRIFQRELGGPCGARAAVARWV